MRRSLRCRLWLGLAFSEFLLSFAYACLLYRISFSQNVHGFDVSRRSVRQAAAAPHDAGAPDDAEGCRTGLAPHHGSAPDDGCAPDHAGSVNDIRLSGSRVVGRLWRKSACRGDVCVQQRRLNVQVASADGKDVVLLII